MGIKIEVDTHTHTDVSSHAYSTMDEMILSAAEIGLRGIAVTNHGVALGDGTSEWHFSGLSRLPKVMKGIRVLKGIEANIIDYGGLLDVPEYLLKKLDIIIASYHDVTLAPSDTESHTMGWLNVIGNPYVNVLGHMGQDKFCFDVEKVVSAAAKNHKIIEINNHSFTVRSGSAENCPLILQCAKKYGCPIVVSSDAHSAYDVGVFGDSLALIEKYDFPEELIINGSLEKLLGFLGL